MNSLSYQEALQILRRAGFGAAAIDRLYRLRQEYLTSELDQPPLDLNRLQFVRWLVTTKRLTDDLPEEQPSEAAPHVTGWAQLKRLLTRFWCGEARAP